MSLTEQEQSYRDFVLQMASAKTLSSVEHMLLTAALGLAGEGGEVVDLVKKVVYHGLPLEEARPRFIKELGDVEWYRSLLKAVLDLSDSEILSANVTKLQARYPSGSFSV